MVAVLWLLGLLMAGASASPLSRGQINEGNHSFKIFILVTSFVVRCFLIFLKNVLLTSHVFAVQVELISSIVDTNI